MKKQLQVEKRRADKLQERLQELLSDTKDRSCMYCRNFYRTLKIDDVYIAGDIISVI